MLDFECIPEVMKMWSRHIKGKNNISIEVLLS
jgi:hypothetical protein